MPAATRPRPPRAAAASPRTPVRTKCRLARFWTALAAAAGAEEEEVEAAAATAGRWLGHRALRSPAPVAPREALRCASLPLSALPYFPSSQSQPVT